jgi:ferric-dicitrate binding protein FerR (iron transport regulator)
MSVREEAAHWFALLRRRVVTLEERAAYQQWAQDATHQSAIRDMQRAWALLGVELDPAVPVDLLAASGPTIARGVVIALTCALLIGVGALFTIGDGSFWSYLDWQNR